MPTTYPEAKPRRPTPAQSDRGNGRGDVLIRGITLAYPGLWPRFTRRIRQLQVDQPGLTLRAVLAPLIERWLAEQEEEAPNKD